MKRKNNQGIVTLIFILIIALIGTLVLVIGQSRLFLALERNRSVADNLVASYQAESEINDLVYKILKGQIASLTFPYTKTIADNFTIRAERRVDDKTQTIDVIATRAFATSQVRAIFNANREISTQSGETQIVLMLDCTGSMDQRDNRATTRMQEQEKAAKNFVTKVAQHPAANSVKLGVGVFGTNSKWMRTADGRAIAPNSNVLYSDILTAIDTGFGDMRQSSPTCFENGQHLGATNIGGSYAFAYNYLNDISPDSRKIAIVITDGKPSARYADPACPPDPRRTIEDDDPESEEAGLVYAKCLMADTQTKWNGVNFGKRDPSIQAIAVTVLTGPERNEAIIAAFRQLLGESNYYAPNNANQLGDIVEEIVDVVDLNRNVIIIKRVIPSVGL